METPDFEQRRDGRERRSLFLTEWEINVTTERTLHTKFTEVAADFGQVFLKSSFLLNGGALIALPPLMQWLDDAQRQQVFATSLWFVAGIVLTAIATAIAYFNFTFLAAISDDRAGLRASDVNNFYSAEPVELASDTEYKKLQSKERWHGVAIVVTQVLAVVFAILAYIAFCSGAFNFKDLVVQQSAVQELSTSFFFNEDAFRVF